MSTSAAQASKFYEQVVKDGQVYTFLDRGSYLVYPVSGTEVIPFWSSRTRLEKIQSTLPKYSGYEIDEESFETFFTKTLGELEVAQIHFGINWSGSRLKGYNISAQELRKNLEFWLGKK